MTRRHAAFVVSLLLFALITAPGRSQEKKRKGLPEFPEKKVIVFERAIRLIAVSPDGGLVAFPQRLPVKDKREILEGGFGHVATVWDVEKGEARHVLTGHRNVPVALGFTDDGKKLISASCERAKEGTVRIHVITSDIANGKTLEEIYLDGRGTVGALAAEAMVLVTLRDGTPNVAQAWDLRTGKAVSLQGHSDYVGGAIISMDGRRVATLGSTPLSMIVWELPSGKKLWSYKIEVDPDLADTHIAFSPDGKRLLLARDRAMASGITLFDADTGKSIWQKPGFAWDGVDFSPDGKFFAVGMGDAVVLWLAAKGQKAAILKGTSGWPVFTRDGRFVFTRGERSIRISEVPKLEQ
jgi:WD40 repeat protein